MKGMVAMELAVVRLLAAEARAAGRDPASDPIPGLRRDVLFTSTADEEAGGAGGAGVDRREPAGVAARRGRLNECGGVSTTGPAAGSTRSRSPRRATPPTGSQSGDLGPRLDAARGERRGPRRGGHPAAGRPRAGPPDAGHGALPRRGGRAAGRGRHAILRAASLGDDPAPRRGGARDGRATRWMRPGAAARWCATRSAQRGPRRRQVQRHPGRRDGRGGLPRLPGTTEPTMRAESASGSGRS